MCHHLEDESGELEGAVAMMGLWICYHAEPVPCGVGLKGAKPGGCHSSYQDMVWLPTVSSRDGEIPDFSATVGWSRSPSLLGNLSLQFEASPPCFTPGR